MPESPRIEFEKIKRRQKLYKSLLLIVFGLFIWILGEILSTPETIKIDDSLNKLVESYTTSFDATVFKDIESKKLFTEAELNNFPLYELQDDRIRPEEKKVFRTISEIQNSTLYFDQATPSAQNSFYSESSQSQNSENKVNVIGPPVSTENNTSESVEPVQ